MHSEIEKTVTARLYTIAYQHAEAHTYNTPAAAAELASMAGNRLDLMTLAAMHLASAPGAGDATVRRHAVELLAAAGAR